MFGEATNMNEKTFWDIPYSAAFLFLVTIAGEHVLISTNYEGHQTIQNHDHQNIQMTVFTKLYMTDITILFNQVHQTIQMTYLTKAYR